MLEGSCGEILECITENGFVIKAMKMFNLKRQICEEFYDVYNGVLPDYQTIYQNWYIYHSFVNTCTQFESVYKKKQLHFFQQMVTELSSGPFIALEIGCSDPNKTAYQSFRRFCGPFNPVKRYK